MSRLTIRQRKALQSAAARRGWETRRERLKAESVEAIREIMASTASVAVAEHAESATTEPPAVSAPAEAPRYDGYVWTFGERRPVDPNPWARFGAAIRRWWRGLWR